ncbi:MAG TPA: response regulator transcription factor [Solirubrobacterales bacterium]
MPTAEMPTAEVDLPVLAAAPEPPAVEALDALPNSSVRAIVIDPHAPSRVGLAALLDEQPWIERCLLASGSEESVTLTRRHRPDVALLDISQTGPFAASITAQIRNAHPGVQILLTSRCRTSPGAPPASLGAVGFLPAGVTGEDVVDAVRAAVLSGEPLDLPVAPLVAGLELSDRERDILVLLGTGATNREIAARLHLGPDSIKKSATALYRKLGVRNRTEAAQRAATVLAA